MSFTTKGSNLCCNGHFLRTPTTSNEKYGFSISEEADWYEECAENPECDSFSEE